MKTSNFIKWQLKKWLPIIISMFFVSAAIFWISRFNEVLTYDTWHFGINGPEATYYGWIDGFNSGLLCVAILGTLMAAVMPYFVYSYRFDKTSSDAYLQFPSKKNQIRNLKIIIALAIVVVLTTVVFWGGVGITAARYASIGPGKTWALWGQDYDTGKDLYTCTQRFPINWAYYGYSYLFIIGSVIGSFFFNSLLISLGNNFVTSTIYCIAGSVILMCITGFFVEYGMCFVPQGKEIAYDMEDFMTSTVGDCLYLYYHLAKCISPVSYKESIPTSLKVMIAIGWVVRYASAPLVFLLKEPSGETFGQPGHRNRWYGFVTYGFMFTIGVLIALSYGEGLQLSSIIYTLVAITGFYLLTAIFNKNFKLTKQDIIPLACVTGNMLIMSFFAML